MLTQGDSTLFLFAGFLPEILLNKNRFSFIEKLGIEPRLSTDAATLRQLFASGLSGRVFLMANGHRALCH